jgi:hypothetical protein
MDKNLDDALKRIQENVSKIGIRQPITVATILNSITSSFVWYCSNCDAVGMHRNLEQIQEEANMHAEPWGGSETSDCSMYIIDMEDRKVYGYITGYEMGSCTCHNCDCDEEQETMTFLYNLEEGNYAGFTTESEG